MKLKYIYIICGVLMLVCLAVFWINTSEEKLKIKHVEFRNLIENRLRFNVNVETNKASNAKLAYWLVNDNDTLYSSVSEDTDLHSLWIVNSKAHEKYQFRVEVSDGEKVVHSKIYDFTTQDIYQATPYFTLDFVDSAYRRTMKDKYFLTQKLTQPGSAIIIDHAAEIVWYQPFEKGVKVTSWTPWNTVLCILGTDSIPFSGGDEIVEVALNGEIKTRLKYGENDMDKMVHHDVGFDASENIYSLTFDERVFDLTPVGGTKQDTILGDGIIVLDRKGKKQWEWSVFDHLNPLDDPNILKDRKDWVHANALSKDKDGDFLISFRDLNQIWKVDQETGAVIWKIGEKGDFEIVGQDSFSGQHAVHINKDGDLMMLDNGLNKQISRPASYRLDLNNMKAYPKIDIPQPKEFFSVPKGSAYMLDDGNILLCLSQPRVLMVIDQEGRELWKVNIGGDPYRLEEASNFINTQSLSNEKKDFQTKHPNLERPD